MSTRKHTLASWHLGAHWLHSKISRLERIGIEMLLKLNFNWKSVSSQTNKEAQAFAISMEPPSVPTSYLRVHSQLSTAARRMHLKIVANHFRLERTQFLLMKPTLLVARQPVLLTTLSLSAMPQKACTPERMHCTVFLAWKNSSWTRSSHCCQCLGLWIKAAMCAVIFCFCKVIFLFLLGQAV